MIRLVRDVRIVVVIPVRGDAILAVQHVRKIAVADVDRVVAHVEETVLRYVPLAVVMHVHRAQVARDVKVHQVDLRMVVQVAHPTVQLAAQLVVNKV